MRAIALALVLTLSACAGTRTYNVASGPRINKEDLTIAIELWNKALGYDVFIERSSDIDVWIEVCPLSSFPPNVLAYTYYKPGFSLIEVSEGIYTKHDRIWIYTHELGHALGLSHTTYGAMNPAVLSGLGVYDVDIAQAKALGY